jgi:hypothetical protein
MLIELINPRQVMVAELHEHWRQVVVIFSGETERHAQGAAVRAACDNLAMAYREIDHAPRIHAA